MAQIAWLYGAADPVRSGELRRLGVPALALDGPSWTCDFLPAPRPKSRLEMAADLAVVPLNSAACLPRLNHDRSVRVVLELDTRTMLTNPHAASILGALANRIEGVVARGRRATLWAEQVLGGAAPVWLIPDPAARKVELAATALQFGIPWHDLNTERLSEGFELWFAEPGDHIEDDEVEKLVQAWSDEGQRRLVVAPRFIRAWLQQAGVRAQFLDWRPDILAEAFAKADRCIFFDVDRHEQARRRVTALRSGAVAAAPAALPAAAFEPAAVAEGWRAVLGAALPGTAKGRRAGPTPVRVLVFMDLVQDLDPLLPIIDELRTRPDVAIEVVVTTWVARRSPRIAAELSARGLSFTTCERQAIRENAQAILQGADAVVAAAESDLPAHAGAHLLFREARGRRIPTFALQHGVENVGLHRIPGEAETRIVADYLFVWFPEDRTPDSVSPALCPRLVHVGRAKPATVETGNLRSTFVAFDSVLAVFENLHWSRYDQDYRTRFLADCTEAALADPDRAVILKPHHAGLWSVKNRHLITHHPANLIIADPTDPFWQPFTAGALVQIADAVVTTPSTVALDAVQGGKPVAIAAYGLDLPCFAPLPLLQRYEDWPAFIAEAGRLENARRRAAFLTRTSAGEGAARRAVDIMTSAARQRLEARRNGSVQGRVA